MLIYAVVPYVVISAALFFFQRRLLYPGSGEPSDAVPALPSDGKRHAVLVATDDGLELHGWLILADGQAVSSLPEYAEQAGERGLVIYFPGNAGRRSDRQGECRLLNQLGLDVLLVDYRGYAENPGAPTEALLHADAKVVWQFARQQLAVPADRICLYGESLGGGVATILAAELCATADPPAALMLTATFSSMTDAAAAHYPYIPVSLLLLDRFPSNERIGAVTCPIAMIHGTTDEIVPVELARKLFQAAPVKSQTGINKVLVEVPGAGHETIPFELLQTTVRELAVKVGLAN